ncbi:hypothetical protein V500_09410 [Pseudogymnoascus sp. VKM F-4518 (FW-2643)]|nr:hypothetical protein V500_09410 [Pseudogymnoascus sp. VKM F-4518 (FW-2643)]
MAGKARKDLAKANVAALSTLHIGSLVLNGAFIVFSLIFRSRSLVTYFVLSIPAFVCQYILESSGRPKYTTLNGKSSLKSAGEDLAAPGLTGYLFDVVWVTWACLLVVLALGDKAWWMFAIVPVFGLWKGWGLIGAARGMMGGPQRQAQGGEEQQQQAAPQNRRQRRMAA